MFARGRPRKGAVLRAAKPGFDSDFTLRKPRRKIPMHRSIGARLASCAIVIFTCAAVLGGCTGSGSSSGGTASGKVIKVGADRPVSGADASDGVPTKNGVLLAVADANSQHLIPGFTLEADARDDAVNGVHNPPQGAKNVESLASDSAVLGIVGPFNSNVA